MTSTFCTAPCGASSPGRVTASTATPFSSPSCEPVGASALKLSALWVIELWVIELWMTTAWAGAAAAASTTHKAAAAVRLPKMRDICDFLPARRRRDADRRG